ncbi:MAG: response regulator (CheY-like receiver, AAA-type ATPase and DNA-binding domain containing protein) [Solidesulfovibrio magneticus str. Maddingley MBC34]|uniref:Response regulator (CheY-like receiver, AAA-type ATPase and DNA-binding domain containing protein) n=1 Tax=Solidesulfovibrio magneticus str. Maddingley MBC34 TaxID=1206767 RepID=K6H6R5_9BACT|nr:MAG: response regulator (CheY-like receiver, AAA-type ATPase and DNA-binding domain containing protein) [Solidesulfovibrio magneticus str. Maddingley MBC34]
MRMEDVNILLVDDEREFTATLAERMELRGLTVRCVYSGEEALKEIGADKPDVVVMDVMMPGLKGLDILRHIKATNPEIQVILLTGQAGTRDGMEGMKLGAFDYLLKPLELDALLGKIAEAAAIGGKA